jgi:hypothetical protein
MELASRIEQAGLDRLSAQKIASMRQSNPTQFESMMAIVMNGTPEQKKALTEVMKLQKQQGGLQLPGDEGDASAAGPWTQYQ